jgi:CRP/FNR family transcriptional regulator
MLSTHASTAEHVTFAATTCGPAGSEARTTVPERRSSALERHASQKVRQTLQLLCESLSPQRQVVHAGDVIHQAGESFVNLSVLNTGCVKVLGLSADGREQMVGLKFRGDWLGFDGIATGQHACTAVAMDTGEIWTLPYAQLLSACARQPSLMRVLLESMSHEIGRDRDSLMSVCTLPADARVAEFLRNWARSLACCGLRADHITLRMTRAEIGNYLGMTLETVSRALSRLARDKLIRFAEKGRREIGIPDVDALDDFMQARLEASVPALQ